MLGDMLKLQKELSKILKQQSNDNKGFYYIAGHGVNNAQGFIIAAPKGYDINILYNPLEDCYSKEEVYEVVIDVDNHDTNLVWLGDIEYSTGDDVDYGFLAAVITDKVMYMQEVLRTLKKEVSQVLEEDKEGYI